MRRLESLVVHLYNLDSSNICREELVIQRLDIVKGDLQQRIENEVKGNAILQASLERMKQAL